MTAPPPSPPPASPRFALRLQPVYPVFAVLLVLAATLSPQTGRLPSLLTLTASSGPDCNNVSDDSPSSLLPVTADSDLGNRRSNNSNSTSVPLAPEPLFAKRRAPSRSEPSPVSVDEADRNEAEDHASLANAPPSPPPPDASVCPHIALLSAARHGSTWLIDSADSCRYSSHLVRDPSDESKVRKVEKYSSDVFSLSELWSKHKGPLNTITSVSAAEYVAMNGSVKLLPPQALKSPARLQSFFEAVRERKVPVVVLKRDLVDAWASFKEAREKCNWAVIKGRRRVRRGRPVDKGWKKYEARTKRHFKSGKALLRKVGVKFDELWYEDVVGQERIWLEMAGCYIRNCNFGR